ncbi:transcription factor cropped isoform X1 [Haemaphysalis longicornis]
MALYHRSSEKRRIFNDFRRQEEEVIGSLVSRLSNRPTSPKTQMEQEKRIRREIANSNERRRMQSINAGFQSLRTLLPHHDGEKLSKAAILQHTAEYIYQLEQEKTRLLSQNSQLKRLLNCQMSQDSDGGSSSDSPLPKRKKADSLDDEGIAGMSPQDQETKDEVLRELMDLRMQLERERRLRMILEEQARGMEAQAYADRILEAPPAKEIKKEEGSDEADPAPVAHPPVEQRALAASPFSPLPPPLAQAAPPSALPAGSTSPPRAHPQPVEPPPSLAADLPQDLSTHSMQPAAAAAVAAPPTREEAPLHTSSPCTSPYHASTSRQNLETIVEAIRHLEGDHLFRDDEPHGDAGVLRSSLNVVVVHEPVLRQQVIQCGSATRRPGVIVANHS